MARNAGHVVPPPPTRSVNPRFYLLNRREQLLRIYHPVPPTGAVDPLTFRDWGPLLRFDHHQALGGKPTLDPDRAIWYGARKLRPCVLEVFGDRNGIELNPYRLGLVAVTEPVRLLDLVGAAAWDAGTVSQVSDVASYAFSQAWARYFYETYRVSDPIDGLRYNGAISGEECVALFESARPKLELTGAGSYGLSEQPLLDEMLRLSRECSLPVYY